MKKIILLLVLVFASNSAFAEKFEFVTVNSVVKKIKEQFGKIESYSAKFVITTEKMGKKTIHRGKIKTLFPNRIRVDFINPPGQKIVSDGKTIWIYIPTLNVVAEQDLDSDSGSLFSSNTKKGLQRLFSKYHYKFASKEQPRKEKDGNKYYILYLRQKESRSGYRNFTLWINENYLITKAVGETSSNKKVEIVFSNINTKENFQKGMFKFDIPSQARVIKNPMISEE